MGYRSFLDEPFDSVVAGVHLQRHGHVAARTLQRLSIVSESGAIGGSDVDQFGSGLLHHFGYPKASTNFDALAPAHQHLTVVGKRSDHQQHSSSVVVDHHRRFGATQLGEQLTDRLLPRSAFAGRKGELDVQGCGIVTHGHRSTPKVGVQQHTGGVDHRPEHASLQLSCPVDCSLGLVTVGAIADCLASDIDAQRMGKVDAGSNESGQFVDAWRTWARVAGCHRSRWYWQNGDDELSSRPAVCFDRAA